MALSRRPFIRTVSLLACALLASSASGAKKSAKPVPEKKYKKPAGELLWDAWYVSHTQQAKGSLPYSSYNERAEIVDGDVQLQVNLRKIDDGIIVEEHYGGVSKDDESVTPLLFHFEQQFNNSKFACDITRQEGQSYRFKVVRDSKENELTKNLPSKTFFVSFFPVWLGKRLKDWKAGQHKGFSAIFEDNDKSGFPVMSGSATLEPADERSERTKTRKITVQFMDQKSTWYVFPSGYADRIEYANQVVEKVSKEKSQRFLSKGE